MDKFKKDPISNNEFELYEQLVESTPLCIKAFDADGKLIFVNKGGRKEHFLKDTDDISRWNWIETVKEKYRPDVLVAFKNGLKGESSRMKMEHTPEGSDHRWCEGIISPIKDKEGKTRMLLFYSIDVTDRETAEAELIKKEKDLQLRNNELGEMNRLLLEREESMTRLKDKLEQTE